MTPEQFSKLTETLDSIAQKQADLETKFTQLSQTGLMAKILTRLVVLQKWRCFNVKRRINTVFARIHLRSSRRR